MSKKNKPLYDPAPRPPQFEIQRLLKNWNEDPKKNYANYQSLTRTGDDEAYRARLDKQYQQALEREGKV